MIFGQVFLVKSIQTDRQTESGAYEPTVQNAQMGSKMGKLDGALFVGYYHRGVTTFCAFGAIILKVMPLKIFNTFKAATHLSLLFMMKCKGHSLCLPQTK